MNVGISTLVVCAFSLTLSLTLSLHPLFPTLRETPCTSDGRSALVRSAMGFGVVVVIRVQCSHGVWSRGGHMGPVFGRVHEGLRFYFRLLIFMPIHLSTRWLLGGCTGCHDGEL